MDYNIILVTIASGWMIFKPASCLYKTVYNHYMSMSLLVVGFVPLQIVSFGARWDDHETACRGGSLHLQCGVNNAVLIDRAVYGLMEHGICETILSEDNKYGCSNDVRAEVNMECMGSPSCRYPATGVLPNTELRVYILQNDTCAAVPIPTEQYYLSTTYHCLPAPVPSENCIIDSSDVTGQEGIIEPSTVGAVCDSNVLQIRTSENQAIRLTMVARRPGPPPTVCLLLGYTWESEINGSQPLCADWSSTHGNRVNVWLVVRQHGARDAYLLQYKFLACPVYRADEHTVIVHQNQTVVQIGFSWNPNNTWSLVCDGQSWRGRNNCAPADPLMVTILLIVCVASVVLVVVLVVVVGARRLCSRKIRRQGECSPPDVTSQDVTDIGPDDMENEFGEYIHTTHEQRNPATVRQSYVLNLFGRLAHRIETIEGKMSPAYSRHHEAKNSRAQGLDHAASSVSSAGPSYEGETVRYANSIDHKLEQAYTEVCDSVDEPEQGYSVIQH